MTLDTYLSYLLAVAFTLMVLMVTGLSIYALYMFFRAVKNEQRLQKEDSLKKEILGLRSELQTIKKNADMNYCFILKALDNAAILSAKQIALRGLNEVRK